MSEIILTKCLQTINTTWRKVSSASTTQELSTGFVLTNMIRSTSIFTEGLVERLSSELMERIGWTTPWLFHSPKPADSLSSDLPDVGKLVHVPTSGVPQRLAEPRRIKFYGHSLGEADYSYFQAIFDSVKLYEGDTRLVFYFRPQGYRAAACRMKIAPEKK